MKAVEPIEWIPGYFDARQTGPDQWEACCPAHDDENPSLRIREGDGGRAVIYCHAGCEPEDIVAAVGLTMWDLKAPSRNGNGAVNGRGYLSQPDERLIGVSSEKLKEWDAKLLNGMDSNPAPPALKRRIPPPPPNRPPKPGALDKAIEGAAKRLGGEEAGRWRYQYADGSTAFYVVRFDTPTGKEYRPFRPEGSGWTMKGLSADRPLYRLPELAEASRVYVCEGEKASDAAVKLGLTATTTANGAKAADKADWTPLADREVVILPDADEGGEKYAQTVASILSGSAASVKIVNLPDLPEHGDMVEYVADRREQEWNDEDIKAELFRLADNAEPVGAAEHREGPVLVNLADVEPEQVQWLWPERIAIGAITLIAGNPDASKSTLTLDIASRVSTGAGWPDRPGERCAPGSVILLSAEDPLPHTVRPRLDAAGADLTRIVAMEGTESGKGGVDPVCLQTDIRRLEQAVERTPDCKLIVIDPISAYLGEINSHRNSEVRGLLAPLAAMAARTGVAVVLIEHLNKRPGGESIQRLQGSIAFVAAARSAWAVAPDKGDSSRRLMACIKNNLSPVRATMAYTLREAGNGTAHVRWEEGTVELTAEEVLAPDQPGPEPEKQGEAEAWLREKLADGSVPSGSLKEQAKRDGVAWRTIERAKDDLDIKAGPDGYRGPWVWSLPESANSDPDFPLPQITWRTLGNLADSGETP